MKTETLDRRRGFSLIEAVLVLALIALITTATTLSLRGRLSGARMEDAVGRLVEFDRVTREAARAQRLELRFDLNAGTLKRSTDAQYSPGGGYRVARLWTDGGLAQSGEVSVPFSRHGQSPTYAVLLESTALRQWIVIAGMTGKAVLIQDERELEELFKSSPESGRDSG